MKIVHILTRLLRAGSEENTISSCLGQLQLGHQVTIIHGREYFRDYYETLPEGLSLIAVEEMVHPLRPLSDLRAIKKLTELLKAIGPDVVHTHQSKAGIVGRLAARRAGVRVIIHGVHIISFVKVGPIKRFIYLTAERFIARFTDGFVNVSPGVLEACVSAGIGGRDRHHVVYSGFDVDKFRRSALPADYAELMGEDSEARVVLMLAAFETRKRHLHFIRAMHKVYRAFPKLRVILAGEGPILPAAQQLVQELGLSHVVKFVGFRKDPEKLIALSHVCTLTSAREGLPRVVVQYLAGGKPVVVTDLPGIGEILDDGVTGAVVGSDDFEEFAAQVTRMLIDREHYRLLQRNILSADISRWTTRRMTDDLEVIYGKYASES